jgi:hypothetical protein
LEAVCVQTLGPEGAIERFNERITETNNATFTLNHAIAEESNFSGPIPYRKGTAETANRELSTRLRIWLPPESALHFQHDQETCKFAGMLNGVAGCHLISC